MGSHVYRDSDGVRRTLLWDVENPYEFHTNTEVDIEGILDNIAAYRDMQPAKSDNKWLARVPMTVYEQSIHEDWDEDDWKKWLNDPQNQPFRIWQGRV